MQHLKQKYEIKFILLFLWLIFKLMENPVSLYPFTDKELYFQRE